MKKHKKLDILDNYVSAHKLLISCIKENEENLYKKNEENPALNIQLLTTHLIKDCEDIIKKVGLYDEAFLNLKKELSFCVENHKKLNPKPSIKYDLIKEFNLINSKYLSYKSTFNL